jgi:hypothetical protein
MIDRLIDLADEFAVAHRALPAFADRLRSRCSPEIWNAPAPVLGVMSAEFDGRGAWTPWAHPHHVSGGVAALVIAVRAHDDDDEDDDILHPVPRWAALQAPAIIDIVAVPFAAPQHWARRTGLARVLGRLPVWETAPVRIYRSPVGWLAGDGAGIAILERERGAAASILRACTGDIVADDADHARELHAIASRPVRVPRIRAAAPTRRVVA